MSKWLNDLSIRHDTIKLLEENGDKTFSDKNHSNVFRSVSQGKTNKNKIKQMRPNQFYMILHNKGNYENETNQKNKPRRRKTSCKWCDQQGLNFQNIQIAHATQYKNNPIKKWAEDLNRYSSKEYIQMTNRYMKRCSTPLIITDMQIKTTVRYHLTQAKMAMMKKSTNNKFWRRYGEREPFYTISGNANWCRHYEEQYGGSL